MVPPKSAQHLRGSRVVLVDDVMTTGATLRACTLALLSAGVARVDVVVLARTLDLNQNSMQQATMQA
jgi:predicted amidophosphoribosyltransferase